MTLPEQRPVTTPDKVLICAGKYLIHAFAPRGWGKTCRICGAPNPVYEGEEVANV